MSKNDKNLPSSLLLGINGLKGIILPRIPPENFKSIGPAITEQLLSAHALVSVTGGPFDVYDVTSNTYNVFPPLIAKICYRMPENMKGLPNRSKGRGVTGKIYL